MRMGKRDTLECQVGRGDGEFEDCMPLAWKLAEGAFDTNRCFGIFES